jgi:hypothetical protein
LPLFRIVELSAGMWNTWCGEQVTIAAPTSKQEGSPRDGRGRHGGPA